MTDAQTQILAKVNSAADVKSLPVDDLPTLAAAVRGFMLEKVSQTGGHLASSLGAVELCIALLRVFEPEYDRVIWDVGHQTYAWKILTGRRDRFSTLRQHGGITGFQNPRESTCDAFVSGHAGVAFAVAEGFAVAGVSNVVAVTGDASLSNGETFEALNNCVSLGGKVILVLNDNEMSISRNVGAFGRMLARLITGVRYNRAKRAAERAGHRLRLTFLRGFYHSIESRIKGLLLGSAYFERFGMRYIGPVDGNDVRAVTAALQVAKEDNRSVVVHVVTVKGKGFVPAELHPTRWHGVGPFTYPISNEVKKNVVTADVSNWSEVFCKALIERARRDSTICAVVAAMKDGTGLSAFAKEFPDRFYDVGICESHAVSFAAGLAAAGKKPVVAIYSTFLQRAVDQMMHDVCLQHLPVIFAVDRAGCVGADGATHHGLYDISMLRCLPGISIAAPTYTEEMGGLLDEAFATGGPWVIRYPRGKALQALVTVTNKDEEATIAPTTVCLLALGDQVSKANAVKKLLGEKGITARVEPIRYVKRAGIDQNYRKEGTLVVSLENGAIAGGWGESIGADMCFGWPDCIVGCGTVNELEIEHGFDAASISRAILKRLLK